MDKELTIPKMSADKSAKNTPNTQKHICSNCLTKPKSLVFQWKKASLGVRSHSVPRLLDQTRISWAKVDSDEWLPPSRQIVHISSKKFVYLAIFHVGFNTGTLWELERIFEGT